MFEKIDHIAIAVEDLDRATELYRSVLGLETVHREYIEDYDVEIATVQVGDTAIELIEGKGAASPIRKFVLTRGPGLHHVAFVVDDIERALDKLRAQGVRLIDETPRRGKADSLVAFVHPKATQGVLYELVQLAGDSE
jgi:methylmalonyl-CoA/ethylmalonyl-CoA epimerase